MPVLLVLFVLAGLSGPLVPATAQPAAVRLLYPANRVVVAELPFRLVLATALDAPAPVATLDNQPLPLHRLTFDRSWTTPSRLKATAAQVGDRAATALWAATVKLSAGAHRLAVGTQVLEVRAGKDSPPVGWSAWQGHPVIAPDPEQPDCAACHEHEGETIGAAPTPRACDTCHDEASVQLIHQHVAEPLGKCAVCHDPHGATRPKSLVDDRKTLCRKCHDAGHAKE